MRSQIRWIAWVRLLVETTCPLVWWWHGRCVWDVAALPELDDFPLAIDFFDYGKSGISEVEVTLQESMISTFPADSVDEAALVTICVGDSDGVDEAVLEWSKALANGDIDVFVGLQPAIVVVVRVVEGGQYICGEG